MLSVFILRREYSMSMFKLGLVGLAGAIKATLYFLTSFSTLKRLVCLIAIDVIFAINPSDLRFGPMFC